MIPYSTHSQDGKWPGRMGVKIGLVRMAKDTTTVSIAFYMDSGNYVTNPGKERLKETVVL
jgi:hypothetical protein